MHKDFIKRRGQKKRKKYKMFSVIASSTRMSTPSPSSNKSGHHHHHHHQSSSMSSEMEHNCEVSNAKSMQDKERETFLSYGIFNMVAGKRTAELLHKQHKHEQHRQSHSDVCGFSELFQHSKHSSDGTSSPKSRHQRPVHAHTTDLSHHHQLQGQVHQHNVKGSKCDLSKVHDGHHKHVKSSTIQQSSSMDSLMPKTLEQTHYKTTNV